MKPLLLFDGDCGFCRRWVARWKVLTGDRVDYTPFQEAGERFPQVSQEVLARSVHLIEPDGTRFSGAEAVFRVLRIGGRGGPLWLYQKIPGVSFFTETFYRLVARHRVLFSRLTKFFWGRPIEPSTYTVTRRVFLSFLGLIYFFAFVSLADQIKGLVGGEGIRPACGFLEAVAGRFGAERFWFLPTLFWFHCGDAILQGICWGGAVLSLGLIFGGVPAPISFLLWFFYLSLFHVGGIFLGYQWDVLLLETGFLAIFFAPWKWRLKSSQGLEPSHAVLWLLRWLLFRLMFSSGMAKLLSGDPSWWDLTALTYHYETQPLPTWVGYYLHQGPLWFQKFSCAAMFGVEIGLPFLIFTPRRTRMAGGMIMILFQIFIMVTGNYNFFNLLTIALCLTLFDDAFYRRLKEILTRKGHVTAMPLRVQTSSGAWPKGVIVPLALFIFAISWVPFLGRLEQERVGPDFLRKIYAVTDPFNLVNSYGLFAVMTKTRLEIAVEGSRDGQIWIPYEFKWKPGDLRMRPKFVEPHQPRLDWQMWFQALDSYRPRSWFQNFLIRLLEGSPDVLRLLKTNPFPDESPKYIRARISPYHFTDLAAKRLTGAWWWKEEARVYTPVLSLETP